MALSAGLPAAVFALEIDGKFAGLLDSFEGGDPCAEVFETPQAGGPTDKSIRDLRYDDIVVTSPFPEGPLAQWVTAFLEGKAPELDGAVILLNLNRQPVRRLEWHGGAIHSVAFPALDATGGRQAGRWTITIRPARTRDVGGSGQTFAFPQGRATAWRAGNFALSMPGIDCTRVVAVDPIVVTQTYLAPASGREAAKPGPLQVSDLVVTVHETGTSDFVSWVEDFIVAGNNSKAHEKDATVRYLAANLHDDLASLSVMSTGIFRVDHLSQVAGVARTTQVKFSMYAEQVRWAPAAEAAVPTAAPTAQPGSTRDVRDVLGRRLAPAEVVRRLREEPASEQRPDAAESRRRLGRDVGLAWAQRHASLVEMRDLAAADDLDWSSLSLPEGHSLADTLAATLGVPLLYDGRLELPRDALAEGVLSGVLEALAEVNGEIDAPGRDATVGTTGDDVAVKAATRATAFRALPPQEQRSIANTT